METISKQLFFYFFLSGDGGMILWIDGLHGFIRHGSHIFLDSCRNTLPSIMRIFTGWMKEGRTHRPCSCRVFSVLLISVCGFDMHCFFCLFFSFLNWSIADLQCHVSLRCTAKLFSFTYTYIYLHFQILFPYRLLQIIEYSFLIFFSFSWQGQFPTESKVITIAGSNRSDTSFWEGKCICHLHS